MALIRPALFGASVQLVRDRAQSRSGGPNDFDHLIVDQRIRGRNPPRADDGRGTLTLRSHVRGLHVFIPSGAGNDGFG